MKQPIHNIRGSNAAEISSEIEAAIRNGLLRPGMRLPTVRALADRLSVSPNTVASCYRRLRDRGILIGEGRRGTRVSARPPLATEAEAVLPASVRNLADGNPDPSLFPPLESPVRSIDLRPRLYGEEANDAELVRLSRERFELEKIPPGPIAIVGGALDGIERILRAHLRPGDRIALEDPSFSGVIDLVSTLGLKVVPMEVDPFGPTPGALLHALESGVQACLVTPRAQNPTGAAIDDKRSRELRRVLRKFPDVLVVEDDHGGPVSGVPASSVCGEHSRWAILRSVAKSLGPDLRLAVLTGDGATVARVQGAQMIGAGWVSNILQQIVVTLLSDPLVEKLLERAAGIYTVRRKALLEALEQRGIEAWGRSGMNVWIPVRDEGRVVRRLFDRGWAVKGGERFRFQSVPAIRVTTAALEPKEAEKFAADLARGMGSRTRTRSA